MQLNEEQTAAVHHNGNLLLLAGAGSGKTLVLAHRASSLLKSGDGNLVAVTFTHDSADELRRRILKMSPGQDKRIRTGTFHALSMLQLRQAGREIKLLKEGDLNRLILHAMSITQEELNFEETKKTIDKVKSELQHGDYDGPGYKTFHAYQKLLHEQKRMDFADLLTHAIDGMKAGSIQPLPMHWLLGDEFQDTDEAQYAWLMLHHEMTGAELTMVGDDDQSIYSFRHALGFSGMERMRQSVGAKVLHLSRNYRCAPEILMPAAKLIHHNEYRAEKQIIPAGESGGRTEVLYPRDREEESEWILRRIQEDSGGWAILARTNRLLDLVEIDLQQSGIPYFRDSDDDFWDMKEPRAIVAIITAIADGAKGLAMPNGKTTASLIQNTARTNRLSAYRKSILFGCRAALFLCGWPVKPIENLIKKLEPLPLQEWKTILKDFPEEWDLTEKKRSPKFFSGINFLENIPGWCTVAAQDPVLMLEGLKRWNQRLLPSVAEPCGIAINAIQKLRGSLAQRLQFIERLSQKKDEPPALGPETVILTTMHGSKGLEWPKVWIVGAEDGVAPHLDGQLEEERRLFYVAMTRAKRILVVSASREGKPSPFLYEARLTDNQDNQDNQ